MSDNRRRSVRHPIGVPVTIEGGGSGTTRDVSASGVFFECQGGLQAGSEVRFEIVLDRPERGERLRLRCSGAVVRIEELDGRMGVAATIASYELAVDGP